jgi:aarF domain-containing kinase
MEMLNGKKLIDVIQDGLTVAFGGDREKAINFLTVRQGEILSDSAVHDDSILNSLDTLTKLKLFLLRSSMIKYLDLLVDVHGRQIFVDAVFNGDPHPGNCLVLDDGRLGLIDYGQTRYLENGERLAFARVTRAIGTKSSVESIVDAARNAGFAVKDSDNDSILAKYAMLFFDSDDESLRLGYPTPQQYFASLMATNPLIAIPDAASTYYIIHGDNLNSFHHSPLIPQSSLPEQAFSLEAWEVPWARNRLEQANDGSSMLRKHSMRHKRLRYYLNNNLIILS